VSESGFAHDELAMRIARVMQERNPKAQPLEILPDVHPGKIPRHVAIIMDGNGRWAEARGLPRMMGHRAGAESVRGVVEEAGKIGVEVVTLYSFSLENWKRPKAEVDALMALYCQYIDSERQRFIDEQIRFVQIGRREGLPAEVLAKRDEVVELTKNHRRGTLVLAVNYGSRAEISDAMREIGRKVQAGKMRAEEIDEGVIERHLGTAGLPDPDLLIRTAGEMRLSNYLLWQLSYAEIHVTDRLWPEFDAKDLHEAVRAYSRRTRKFGGLVQ
jgi:undecaprenyl diphosphate synthase